eukprot:GHVN01002550.1.p1 GENE.GHVN01002550.1~~GHVN01002550.1.p1  ORF type:complete len:261 (+),score=34.43 GHVN01002550.1:33-815(+)
MDADASGVVLVKNMSSNTSAAMLTSFLAYFGEIKETVLGGEGKQCEKGTAIVYFKNKRDAFRCISRKEGKTNLVDENEALILDGRILQIFPFSQDKKSESGDTRNWHLLDMGRVFSGTVEYSQTPKYDLQLRERLEREKRQKMKSPMFFVSSTRLSIHNIPSSVDKTTFKKTFQEAGGGKIRHATMIEHLGKKGKGSAVHYGFVEFFKHETAMKALKRLNNKPVFKERRLIVSFAIENRGILQKRDKEKIRMKQKHSKSN